MQAERAPWSLTFADMWIVGLCWSPRKLLVEVLAELTVQALGVVLTHTPPMDLEWRRLVKEVFGPWHSPAKSEQGATWQAIV